MAKQYGLIDPKTNKKIKPSFAKHAAFASDSDSDSQDPKKMVNMELGESQKRQTRVAQEKALAEDPTIYQYDELYDDIESKRKEAKADKSKEERKPKYIKKLLETAEKRKKEQERRVERQVQKEREAEGEMYKDKESFVTSAYRAKLEEIKKAEEEEKREEYLESIGDVTKQCDLDGFYRHIYSQKLGENKMGKDDAKVDVKEESDFSESARKGREKSVEQNSACGNKNDRKGARSNEEFGSSKSRQYRKRHSDDDENVEAEKNDSSKKVHLQSNLDADSDFSIDSNSSSSDSESDSDKCEKQVELRDKSGKSPERISDTVENNQNGSEMDQSNIVDESKGENVVDKENVIKEEKKKESKIDIWKKRTVGAVFDAALQRYYERKAARISG